jgi:hypothetical protein
MSSLCGKVSNNKHYGCPARMNDARHFTDYRPNCHLNNIIKANNKILNSYDFRMFLTNNANKLMDLNRKYACDKNCCSPCMDPYNQGTMLPENKMNKCSASGCITNPANFDGIGTGRSYSESEEKCPGVGVMNQKTNCCAPNNDLANYYPNDTIDSEAYGTRVAIPSGGNILSGGDPAYYN